MIRRVLITGANSGLGKEAARQFALNPQVERVYLGCRNPKKADEAKTDLERVTQRKIFEVLPLDVADLPSVRAAAAALREPVDALIMNAGGMASGAKSPTGATSMFATNVLGHALLVDELLAAGKLKEVAVYAGSEAARGVRMMGMKRPNLGATSVEDVVSVIDGSLFGGSNDPMRTYGPTKYVAALWMASMARRYPAVKFVTVSPGGTNGTAIAENMGGAMGAMMKYLAMPTMSLFGMVHRLEEGAARYVKAATEPAFKTGRFYASAGSTMVGPVVEVALQELANEAYQDNAYQAVHRFLS